MASDRKAWAAVHLATLAGASAGTAPLVQAHLYACAAVLLLVALWAAGSVWAESPQVEVRWRAGPVDVGNVPWKVISRALDQFPSPFLLLARDGGLRAANQAARTLFRTDDRVTRPEGALVRAICGESAGRRVTLPLRVQGGTRLFALSRIDLPNDEEFSAIVMLLDVQPEVRAAEAAALRDTMQVLSHEIMNALTPVASLAATALELLNDRTPEATAAARDALETLERRAGGLTRFVEAYRRLAKLPPPNLRPASVSSLMDETARLFQSRWASAGATLHLEKPQPDVVASMDTDLMVHALMNILANAVDAASLSGAAPFISIAAPVEAGGVKLVVRDNGPGVPEAERDRIFQPFYTTKADGTGVGLSFARQVALSHGGELRLAPLGPGATFELSL